MVSHWSDGRSKLFAIHIPFIQVPLTGFGPLVMDDRKLDRHRLRTDGKRKAESNHTEKFEKIIFLQIGRGSSLLQKDAPLRLVW